MTGRRPAAVVTVDGRALTAAQAALTTITVDLGVGAAHDRAMLCLGAASPLAPLSIGAPIAVALGYGDDVTDVFTGTVTSLELRPWGTVVEALAETVKLSRTRVGRAFLSSTVGDIVGDLAADAEVTVGDVEAGPVLAAYHVDERRTAWHHVQDLARLTGCESSSAPDGALRFTAAPGAAPGGAGGGLGGLAGGLAAAAAGAAAVASGLLGLGGGTAAGFGAGIVTWSHAQRASGDGPAVVAHGSGSALGADAWHVVTKEPDGGAPDRPTLVPAAVRHGDVAAVAEAALAAAATRRAGAGTVTLVGDPALRAGEPVPLTGLPGDPPPVRAIGVHHRVGGVGFLTDLTLEGVS